MTKIECPFCGSAGPKSREHRLPSSWKKYFHLVEEIVQQEFSNGELKPARSTARTQLDFQYQGICRVCNNGWLREIDEAAEARIVNLALRRTSDIPSADIVPVVRSLFRAALMTIWGNRQNTGYPAEAFTHLHSKREPPYGTHLFVGHSDDLWLHPAGHVTVLSDQNNMLPGGVFLVSFSVERLFVVVFVPRDNDVSSASLAARSFRKKTKGLMKEIWPNPRRVPKQVPHARAKDLNRGLLPRITQLLPLLLDEQPKELLSQPIRDRGWPEALSAKDATEKMISAPTAQPPSLLPLDTPTR